MIGRPALTLVVLLLGCASPPTDGPPIAEQAAPRFAPVAPTPRSTARATGYPMGDRSTFFRDPVPRRLSQPSRRDLRGPADSPGADTVASRARRRSRASAASSGRRPAPSTTTSRATRPRAARSRAATRSSSSATSTAAPTGIASPRGRWPRRSPRCSSASRSRRVTSGRWTIPPPRTCRRSPAPNTGARRSAICCRCPRACASSRSTRGSDDVTQLAADTFMQAGAGGVGAVTPFNARAAPSGDAGSPTPRSRRRCSASCCGARSAGRSPSTCRRRSGSRWGRKPTPPGSSTRAGQEVDILLPQRGAARLRAARPAARPRRELARPAAHPRRVDRGAPRTCAPDQPHLRPGTATPFFGYGYQAWIFPGERRMFALLGVRGQAIFVDPAAGSSWSTPRSRRPPAIPGGRERKPARSGRASCARWASEHAFDRHGRSRFVPVTSARPGAF